MSKSTLATFRKAASNAGSDLYDVSVLLDQADRMRQEIEHVAAHRALDNPANLGGHSQARYLRATYPARLVANLRAQVQAAHDAAAADSQVYRLAGAAPELVAGAQERRANEIARYRHSLIDSADEALTDAATSLCDAMNPARYAEAAAMAEELHRRGDEALAVAVADAVRAAEVAYQSDPRYLAAQERTARAKAWLTATAGDDDPELPPVGGVTVRVSALFESDSKAKPEPAPKSAAPLGKIDYYDPAGSR